jgi:C4-type Zn-finger protein
MSMLNVDYDNNSMTYGQQIAITTYVCQRCGFIVEIKNQDVIQNILLLTQSTCELKYEDVQNLLGYMAVKETHEL